jgi:hypothetical protein
MGKIEHSGTFRAVMIPAAMACSIKGFERVTVNRELEQWMIVSTKLAASKDSGGVSKMEWHLPYTRFCITQVFWAITPMSSVSVSTFVTNQR